jgi:murein DD-endopeptidase MepM/ murein hydrolase activator NlpD
MTAAHHPVIRLFLGTIALVLGLSACGGPVILSSWSSLSGVKGGRRSAPHAGVDFGERQGAPVLAAIDGDVVWARDTQAGCGKGIGLSHTITSPKGSRFTLYCHLDAMDISRGQSVKRGQPIGRVGTTGNAFGVPHVHFEVSSVSRSHPDGDLSGTEDPEPHFVGCFDPQQTYPTDKFVLTYPVQCTK